MAWSTPKLNDAPSGVHRGAPIAPIVVLAVALWGWSAASMAVQTTGAWLGPERAAGFSLAEALPRAQVSVREGRGERACPYDPGGRRFSCGSEPWAFVGPYGGRAAGHSLRCTWVHPPARGDTLMLRFEDVPTTGRLTAQLALLEGVAGGAEVRMRVHVNDRLVGTAATSTSRDLGLVDVELPGDGGRGPLRLEIHAADHGWRLACADLRIDGGDPAPAPARGP